MSLHRRGIILLPILILILSGCFRQASDPIEPVNESLSDGSGQVIPTQTETNTDGMLTDVPTVDAQTGPTATEQAAPTDEGIPTDAPLPTNTPPSEPTTDVGSDTDSPQIQVTASTPVTLTTNTPVPLATSTPLPQATTDASTDGGSVGPVDLATDVPQFVTPQAGGSGAVTTPTPFPTQSIDSTPTEPTQPEPDEPVDDSCIYVVQRGNTLFRIAVDNGTTIDAILAVNPGLNPDLIIPGDEIILPDCDPDETAADDVEEPTEEAPEEDDDDTTVVGSPGELVHVVAGGETLSTIAQRYGVTIASIIEENQLTNPNRLSIGQELVIPQEQ